jgi:hypothetical protein
MVASMVFRVSLLIVDYDAARNLRNFDIGTLLAAGEAGLQGIKERDGQRSGV